MQDLSFVRGGASQLNLRGRKLDETRFCASLKSVPLRRVTHLDASHNLLARLHVEEGARAHCLFEGFDRLECLDLSHNPLDNVHPNSLASLRGLKVLIATDLPLSKDTSLRFLKNLTGLEKLTLSGHKIFALKPHSLFSHLGRVFPNLTQLDLRPAGGKKTELSDEERLTLSRFCPRLQTLNGSLFLLPRAEKPLLGELEKENHCNKPRRTEPLRVPSALQLNQSFSQLNLKEARPKSRVRHTGLNQNSFDSADDSSLPQHHDFLNYVTRLTRLPETPRNPKVSSRYIQRKLDFE